jgi:hypothetical protein
MLQRQAGNRAAVLSLQRALEDGVEPAAEADQAEPQLEQIVAEQVAALPDVDGAAVPAPEQVEAAKDEAAGVRDELGELGLAGAGPVADWYRNEVGGDGAAAAPVVEELQAAGGDLDLPSPAPAKPGRLARAKAVMSGAAASVGRGFGAAKRWIGGAATGAATAVKGWFSRTFSREGRRDLGARGQAVVGMGAPVAGHLGYAASAGQAVVDNPATVGAAELVGGSGAADQVHQAGEGAGHFASAAGTSPATLEHPGDFAHSFTSGGFELAHAVASVVGIFFSAIKAGLDVRSAVSTVRVIKGLKEAKRSAARAGASPALVEAVDYAIRQKYEKLIKRALGAAVALAALGVGLAILIANPAGASLAAVILGGIGAGFFLYKLGRWAWKKWKTETLGEKRNKMAQRLYNQMRARDVLALEAVRSLHLVPETVEASPDGPGLIARKLKSA